MIRWLRVALERPVVWVNMATAAMSFAAAFGIGLRDPGYSAGGSFGSTRNIIAAPAGLEIMSLNGIPAPTKASTKAFLSGLSSPTMLRPNMIDLRTITIPAPTRLTFKPAFSSAAAISAAYTDASTSVVSYRNWTLNDFPRNDAINDWACADVMRRQANDFFICSVSNLAFAASASNRATRSDDTAESWDNCACCTLVTWYKIIEEASVTRSAIAPTAAPAIISQKPKLSQKLREYPHIDGWLISLWVGAVISYGLLGGATLFFVIKRRVISRRITNPPV